ncbi:MAG: hypothetical protein FWH28_06230 [Clostridiales bacterium]|nr:hypothetical protein [Clostridiales bacterium]
MEDDKVKKSGDQTRGGRRSSGGGRRQDKAEPKDRDAATAAAAENKRGGLVRRGRKSDVVESAEAGKPKEDKPITFNAHALDMEPGFVIQERPSVDLTYQDFTRESYDESDRRPFVPKKRNEVPYELSDTPRTQQVDSRDSRNNGRRQASSPDSGKQVVEAAESGDGAPAAVQLDSRTKLADQGKDKRTPLRTRDDKGKPSREGGAQKSENTQAGNGSREKGRPQQDQAMPQQPANRRNPRTQGAAQARKSQEKSSGNSNDAKSSAGQAQTDTQQGESADTAKESLLRPYWMKSKGGKLSE